MAGRPIKRMIVKASALASLKRLETFPTQPFPLKPPPLARNSYKPEDLVTANDTNETHAKACQALVEQSGGAYNQGPYTP